MQKFFCATGIFLLIILILQDCLIPAEGVRIRVVKVKKQQDNHYTKRQASRSSYTDVPLAGDPEVEAESFRVNTNTLNPEDNPYNAGNRHVDYPLNNVGNNQYNNQNNNNNNNNRYQQNNNHRYEDERSNNDYNNQGNYNRNQQQYSGNNNNQRFQQSEINDNVEFGPNNNNNNNNNQRQQQQQQQQDALRPRPVRKDTDKEGDCPGCGHNIPGDAGVDYPNYHTPPKTTFTCSKQSYSGYYADVEARCQVFWICQKNRADAFLCPNGTIFNQQVFVCDWWFNSDCNTAPDYYSRNQYLYAGPTVDLFGNPLTPQNNNNNPFNANNANRNPTQPIRRTTPATPAPQPQRLLSPQQQQQPQQQRAQSVQQQQQAQQRIAPQNNGNGYNNNNNNRNFPVTTSLPPVIHHNQQQGQGGYSKRSQQSFSPAQNKLDYNGHHDDRLKQPFNYPVPDNSLAAVDGEYGLKMNNNYKVEYVDQRHHHIQNPQPAYQQSQRHYSGYHNDNQAGYTNTKQDVQLPPRVREPLFSSSSAAGSAAAVASSPSASPPASSSINAVALQGVGYGMKTSANVKRNPFIDINPAAAPDKSIGTSSRFSGRAEAPPAPVTFPSTTTKRNAIDYDTENTTPYASSFDEELLATLTTPRYGDVISKPNIYSTEIESSRSEETTTVAPLTFGQKLTRAARKRNTSRWGNWKTMLLGNDY